MKRQSASGYQPAYQGDPIRLGTGFVGLPQRFARQHFFDAMQRVAPETVVSLIPAIEIAFDLLDAPAWEVYYQPTGELDREVTAWMKRWHLAETWVFHSVRFTAIRQAYFLASESEVPFRFLPHPNSVAELLSLLLQDDNPLAGWEAVDSATRPPAEMSMARTATILRGETDPGPIPDPDLDAMPIQILLPEFRWNMYRETETEAFERIKREAAKAVRAQLAELKRVVKQIAPTTLVLDSGRNSFDWAVRFQVLDHTLTMIAKDVARERSDGALPHETLTTRDVEGRVSKAIGRVCEILPLQRRPGRKGPRPRTGRNL